PEIGNFFSQRLHRLLKGLRGGRFIQDLSKSCRQHGHGFRIIPNMGISPHPNLNEVCYLNSHTIRLSVHPQELFYPIVVPQTVVNKNICASDRFHSSSIRLKLMRILIWVPKYASNCYGRSSNLFGNFTIEVLYCHDLDNCKDTANGKEQAKEGEETPYHQLYSGH